MLAYYAGLLREFPKATKSGFDRVLGLLAILVVVVLAFNRQIGEALLDWRGIDPAWAIVAALAFAAAELLRLNYFKVDDYRRRLVAEHQEHLFDPFHYKLIADLTDSTMLYEYDRMVGQLERGVAPQTELIAQYDAWDSRVGQHLALIDSAEVDFFRRPLETGLVSDADWRAAMMARLGVRKARLEQIQARQKVRYDQKVAKRKATNRPTSPKA